MKRALDWIIQNYGEAVTVRTDGADTQARAFFQPVTQKSLQNIRSAFPGLGELPQGQYLYIGPVDVAADRGSRVRWRDRWYDLRQAAEICVGGTALYRYGLAVRGGEDDPWS